MINKRKHSIKLKETAQYFVQIGRLLEQGYPLNTALTFIQLHVPSRTKEKINEVLTQLNAGNPVHEAFQTFEIPLSFKSFLYFYEEQGNIAEGFIHAGLLLEQREKMRNEIMKLLRYPILLLWLCLFILILMYYLVVPHFQSFFLMTSEIPLFTKVVFKFLEFTPYLVVITLFFVCLCACFYWYKIKSWSPYQKVMQLLSLPYVGNYVKIVITYYFSLQLGRLSAAGLSLQEALSLFKHQDYLPFFQQECTELMHELHQGHSFSDLLQARSYLRKELAFVVENGEKTSYFANDLIHYSEMLYRELNESFQKALRYIQPIFFLIVGGIVFMLFLATMLPMFQMVGVL